MQELETYRVFIFLAVIIMLGLYQRLKPAFEYKKNNQRLKINLLMFISATALLRFAFPFGLYQMAQKINENNISLLELNQLPVFFSFLITILIFDFFIYWQHRFFHTIPVLWRMHEVHHADKDMSLTTGLRFHPLEIVLSASFKMILILILGPFALAYLLYEILLNSFAMFTHSNIYIPEKFERILRVIFVTPQMHYPHHNPRMKLLNSNYGNIFSFWDRLFRSYTPGTSYKFGLHYIEQTQAEDWKFSLKQPFIKTYSDSNHNQDKKP
ncbi:MAG: hypothetical protein CME62_04455 [Halobacteriovoraceae bacterium]|nr:hypothetical protein [Halobacteriovoraceae bacterium]|tara:strand:+ start:14366 stop:15172 length:807 start_codon:yes stop_codon:yes gene_type:complete